MAVGIDPRSLAPLRCITKKKEIHGELLQAERVSSRSVPCCNHRSWGMPQESCCPRHHPPPPPMPAPAPTPTASIRVTPSVIDQGQSATLAWTTTNATAASISGIGTVAPSGSQSVSPTVSTTFTLIAKGPGGSAEATARITVNPPPPQTAHLPPSITEEQLFEQNMQTSTSTMTNTTSVLRTHLLSNRMPHSWSSTRI